jgi:hypothetical protein
MIDVASDNTSLVATQLTLEFLGRIVEHPGYRKRHPMKAPIKAPIKTPAARGAQRARRARRRPARAR